MKDQRARPRLTTIIWILVVLNGIAFTWMLLSRRQAPVRQISPAGNLREVAIGVESRGEMSVPEVERLANLHSTLQSNGTIEAGDLDWLISLLDIKRGPTPEIAVMRRQKVLITLRTAKKLTSDQKARLFNAIKPLFSTNEGRLEGTDRVQAAKTSAILGDKRAVPLLLELLNHRQKKVVTSARKSLQALGYS